MSSDADLAYWDNWDRIIREQRAIQGGVVYKLINDVAKDTENMDSFELDKLEEGGLFV